MISRAAATGAAGLYTAGAVVLFGVRSWRHKQATGRSGFNGFTPGRSRSARVAGACFAAAVAAGLTSPLLARRHASPQPAQPATRRLPVLAGAAAAVTGFAVAAAAQDAMGESWRIGVDPTERTELVTSGVFGLVRNPIFTAMVLAQAGTAVMAPTGLSVAGAGLLVAGVQLQTRRVEEPYLVAVHGPAYTGYAARTGRFLPGLGQLRPAG